jgi:hypothetical protein
MVGQSFEITSPFEISLERQLIASSQSSDKVGD